MTKVSVVIPVYNDAAMLERCLEALAGQTRAADEIVVVNNGSTDNSAQVAQQAGARVVDEPLRGIPAATAAGFDAAEHHIIARIDADSVPPADWLNRVVTHFESNPELAGVTGPATFYGSSPLVHWVGSKLYIGGYYWFVTWLLGGPPLFGSNCAVSATAWQDIRQRVHRTRRDVHDDLDISLNLSPDMDVRFDPWMPMPVSSRPFSSWRGIGRRLGWAYTTFAVNHEEESLLQRRAKRRAYAKNVHDDEAQPRTAGFSDYDF